MIVLLCNFIAAINIEGSTVLLGEIFEKSIRKKCLHDANILFVQLR